MISTFFSNPDLRAFLGSQDPVIKHLVDAVIAFSTASGLSRQALGVATAARAKIDSRQWTMQIENATQQAENLQSIRVAYEESVLNFLSLHLLWAVKRRIRAAKTKEVEAAIVEAIVALDKIRDGDWDAISKRQTLEHCIVGAARVAEFDEESREDVRANESLAHHAGILQAIAFKALGDELQQHSPECEAYPKSSVREPGTSMDAVGPANPQAMDLPDDLRTCLFVSLLDVVDCDPVWSLKLSIMLKDVREHFERCQRIFAGLVNCTQDEDQHGKRLMVILNHTAAAEAPDKVALAVKRHQERRFDFWLRRRSLCADLHTLDGYMAQMVKALKDSVQEGLARLSNFNCMSTASDLVLAIFVNNCLVADRDLRLWSRRIERMRKVWMMGDATSRLCEQAIADEYSKIAQRYARAVAERPAPKPVTPAPRYQYEAPVYRADWCD